MLLSTVSPPQISLKPHPPFQRPNWATQDSQWCTEALPSNTTIHPSHGLTPVSFELDLSHSVGFLRSSHYRDERCDFAWPKASQSAEESRMQELFVRPRTAHECRLDRCGLQSDFPCHSPILRLFAGSPTRRRTPPPPGTLPSRRRGRTEGWGTPHLLQVSSQRRLPQARSGLLYDWRPAIGAVDTWGGARNTRPEPLRRGPCSRPAQDGEGSGCGIEEAMEGAGSPSLARRNAPARPAEGGRRRHSRCGDLRLLQ